MLDWTKGLLRLASGRDENRNPLSLFDRFERASFKCACQTARVDSRLVEGVPRQLVFSFSAAITCIAVTRYLTGRPGYRSEDSLNGMQLGLFI